MKGGETLEAKYAYQVTQAVANQYRGDLPVSAQVATHV